jgi:hypothetical protein
MVGTHLCFYALIYSEQPESLNVIHVLNNISYDQTFQK